MAELEGHRQVGVAIVGAGFMGGVHAQVLGADPRAEIRWAVDLDQRLAVALADASHARPTTELGEALTDPGVGLVVVATPPPTHAPLATQALDAGRHVLVEKPMVLSSGDAERLGEMSRDRGLVVAYGGNFVYSPKFVRAAELCRDHEAMGDLHSVRAVFRIVGPDDAPGLTRAVSGGGALTDIGWHAVEMCRLVLGRSEVRAVTASVQPGAREEDGEVRGVMVLHCAGGVTAQCDVSWLWPGGEQVTLEATGTRGTVSADLWQGMGLSAYTDSAFADVWEPNAGWTFPNWEWIRNSGYIHQDRRVLSAIVDGAPVDNHPGEAAAILRILEAAYASAGQGRTVRVEAAAEWRGAREEGEVLVGG